MGLSQSVLMVKNPHAKCRSCTRRRFALWVGKIPWSNGNLLQYSCLENSTDRGPWRAPVHGVTKSQT